MSNRPYFEEDSMRPIEEIIYESQDDYSSDSRSEEPENEDTEVYYCWCKSRKGRIS